MLPTRRKKVPHHHIKTFVRRGEKASWGPRRNRLGSAAAQLLKSLKQEPLPRGEFPLQEREKKPHGLVSVVRETCFRAYRTFWCFGKALLRKESSLKPLSESMPWHSGNSLPLLCLSTSICRKGIYQLHKTAANRIN